MDELTNCGLLVNGKPLSWYGGAALLDYSIGETALDVETFQGVNRTSWRLLKSIFGRRPVKITVIFTGETLHAAKLQRSKFNAAVFGRCELFISDDGFYYDCVCQNNGPEILVGIGEREAKIKSDYQFTGIRRDALARINVPAGGSMFCRSTMPFTDCRLSATAADSETLTGNPVTVKNSAGKTITNISSVITPSASGVSAVTIQQSNGTETSSTSVPLGKTVYGGSVDATGGELTETHAGSVYDPVDIPAALDTLIVDATTLETATPGPVVTFDCELGEYPLSALTVDIEPVQDLNGYDNPWPAAGGKNIFDFSSVSANNGTISGTANDFICAGSGQPYYNRAELDITNLAGQGTFYLSGTAVRTGTSDNNACFQLRYNDGTNHTVPLKAYVNNIADAVDVSFSVPAEATSAQLYMYVNNYATGGIGLSSEFTNVRISSSQNTTWSPYTNICPISGWTEAKVWVKSTHDTSSSPTVTIDLNGTRYGGTLDVLTGVLTVDREEVDLGTLDYTLMGNTSKRQAWQHQFNDIKKLTTGNTDLPAISSQFKAASLNATWLPGIMAPPGLNSTWVCFCVNSGQYANADEFKAAMSGVQFVYELETPQTVQLTPQQVFSLLGANNVWADTGAISALSYRDGNVSTAGILTQSGALVSGESVAYPLATPAVSSIAPITAPALLSGDITISGSSGALSVTVGKQVPNPYPLGGAAFLDVSAGDVLVFDGINGAITKNGQPYAASVSWVDFPSLTPGQNANDAPDAVTVEYYPSYI